VADFGVAGENAGGAFLVVNHGIRVGLRVRQDIIMLPGTENLENRYD